MEFPSLEVFKTQLDVVMGNLLYPAWGAVGREKGGGCGQTKLLEVL